MSYVVIMEDFQPLNGPPESLDLLGLEDVSAQYGNYSSHDISMINIARIGLTVESLYHFASQVSLSKEKLAYLLNTSTRNLRRYSEGEKLSSSVSEKLLLLAEIYQKGIKIFGSIDLFNEWLEEANLQFGNRKPIQILDTFIGYRLIVEELIKIEHGVFS